MQGQLNIEEMIQNLLTLDDETWGLYAFSRELLKRRILLNKKIEMITRSMECGRDFAQRCIREYGTRDTQIIAEKLKLKIEFQDSFIVGKRIQFSGFAAPDKIEIIIEPVRRAVQLISKDPALVELFSQDGILDIILGHEIFHFLEERFKKEIYTRTEKILLWEFMGIKNRSTIRTLGEIGAMAFTKELNELTYSPFILDILLYFSYDSSGTRKIYRNILGISSGRYTETVENNES